jgi:hypothetical protein
MKNKKKLVGIMTAVLLVGGVAFAAWTANGDGTGTADATSAIDLDINPISGDDLYPGGSFDITVDLVNTNPYAVQVSSIHQTAATAITSDVTACTATSVVYATQTDGWLVPANDTLEDVVLTDALTMPNAGADDDCQGATFTIPLSLTGASSGS